MQTSRMGDFRRFAIYRGDHADRIYAAMTAPSLISASTSASS